MEAKTVVDIGRLNLVASRKAMCGPGWAELAEDMDVRERDGEDVQEPG
jgi:hypothetical protein